MEHEPTLQNIDPDMVSEQKSPTIKDVAGLGVVTAQAGAKLVTDKLKRILSGDKDDRSNQR